MSAPSEWAPLVAALAGFVALQGPATANLILTWANRRKLAEVHQSTNGSLSSLVAEVAALRKIVDAQQRELALLRGGPGPV